MDYQKFLADKEHSTIDFGLPLDWMPEGMFDFQKYVAEHASKKGRCAVFLDTGLGKTLIELVLAYNYARKTNKPVLIITPLAVAFQFLLEAEKFGIDDVSYSKDGTYKTKIVICNYERLSKFDSANFDCVILDESSILKNFDGAIKNHVTAFLKKVKYRYLFTATPSPNDFIELGTSSEAIGSMGYTDMLTKFFTNNEDTISPTKIGVKWVLKGHAQESFFRWVSSWSISMRKPSDLGFDDSLHVLPELIVQKNLVKNVHPIEVNGQMGIFALPASRLTEVRAEQRVTIKERCKKAYELASGHERSVYWCNLNDEADLLQDMDSEAKQVSGSMDLDKKEEILVAFSKGEIKRLITKARITAFGLNWQHCNHTVYFPTFSYEQYYQAIRRFWRFGQKREVFVDLVYTDGQQRCLDSLMAKAKKAEELFGKLNDNIHSSFTNNVRTFDNKIILPSFIS